MDALSTQIALKKFDTVRRGYDPRRIDAYLSDLGDQVAKLEDALRVARSRIVTLEHQARDVRDADTVVSTAFLAAADAKAKLIEEGQARAAEIVADAQRRAATIDGGGTGTDEAESLLREARRRLEESEHDAATRREEAEREAAAIIAQAKARLSEAGASPTTTDPAAAADELERLVATLGELKEAAREGLEQASSLEADIEAIVAAPVTATGSSRILVDPRR